MLQRCHVIIWWADLSFRIFQLACCISIAVAQILGLAKWSRFCQQVPGRARLDDWRWDGAMRGWYLCKHCFKWTSLVLHYTVSNICNAKLSPSKSTSTNRFSLYKYLLTLHSWCFWWCQTMSKSGCEHRPTSMQLLWPWQYIKEAKGCAEKWIRQSLQNTSKIIGSVHDKTPCDSWHLAAFFPL